MIYFHVCYMIILLIINTRIVLVVCIKYCIVIDKNRNFLYFYIYLHYFIITYTYFLLLVYLIALNLKIIHAISII